MYILDIKGVESAIIKQIYDENKKMRVSRAVSTSAKEAMFLVGRFVCLFVRRIIERLLARFS